MSPLSSFTHRLFALLRENSQFKFPEPCRISNNFDPGNLSASDSELKHARQLPSWSPHDSHGSTHQHRLNTLRKLLCVFMKITMRMKLNPGDCRLNPELASVARRPPVSTARPNSCHL